MAFVEYILLALLGSTGAAAPGAIASGPATRTLGADVVVQPSGGAGGDFEPGSGLVAQKKPVKIASGKEATKTRVVARRHHRTHRRHTKVLYDSGKKAIKK